ncbi:MAG: DUF4115 domain-containing protein [Candidatus Omnitrophota bacterium]|nr:DUF4115 domain-containing protein [Candidatus Omnitrophota bacterium]
MRKAGEYLKNIREEKGYSVEQVSKGTKISAPVIRAIEGGRTDNVEPIYLKGFLKLYCRFLGIVWADFLKEHPLPMLSGSAAPTSKYGRPVVNRGVESSRRAKETSKTNAYTVKKTKGEPKASAEPSPGPAFILNNKKNIFIVLLVIASLLSLAVVYKGFVFIKENIPKIQLPRVKPKSQAAVSPKKPPQKVIIKGNKPVKSLTPPKKSPQQDASKVKVQASGGSTMLTTGSIKETKPKAITVVVRAQEDNFLKVKVDAQMVYQGVLRKGKAESWTAKEKIELSVADAGAIVLEIGEKIFSSLGKRGQPIKNILINREGLKVL